VVIWQGKMSISDVPQRTTEVVFLTENLG